MAERMSEVAEASSSTRAGFNSGEIERQSSAGGERDRLRARRVEAMSLRIAGFTYPQIAERLETTDSAASEVVSKALSEAENESAEQLRSVENQRLDRAQASIWTKVLAGDLDAVDRFLKISARRAKMNGLDEPTNVNMSVSVKQEMENALATLENIVDAEVVSDENNE